MSLFDLEWRKPAEDSLYTKFRLFFSNPVDSSDFGARSYLHHVITSSRPNSDYDDLLVLAVMWTCVDQ